MFHTVIRVEPTDDFKVYVYFDDGVTKLFDVKPYLNKGVFQKISNPKDFAAKCTVMNKTLAWDLSGKNDPTNCIDIDSETIYSSGVTVLA